MSELSLTAINPTLVKHDRSRPADLTWGQSFRYDVGLPFHGAQPAVVYIEVADRDPDWTSGKPDQSQAMVGVVPKGVDISTREKQMHLLQKFESMARELIEPSTINNIRILHLAFQPAIDERGFASHADGIGIGRFTTMKPQLAKSRRLMDLLPKGRGDLLTLAS